MLSIDSYEPLIVQLFRCPTAREILPKKRRDVLPPPQRTVEILRYREPFNMYNRFGRLNAGLQRPCFPGSHRPPVTMQAWTENNEETEELLLR